jgi:hypothetical protein
MLQETGAEEGNHSLQQEAVEGHQALQEDI